MPKMLKFPKMIYVGWETYQNEKPFLLVDEEPLGGVNGDKVAIYELKEVKTKRLVESLE